MKRSITTYALLAVLMVQLGAADAGASPSRLKDIARLDGLSEQPLLGYGLIVGLNGTGDGQNSEFTVNSMAATLERLGVTVDPARLKLKNVAAVVVTASLPPNAVTGSLIDVKVSSLGDASSLEGGVLIMTPMKSANGEVRVLAQGAVSIGGFNINTGSGNSFRKNHATVGAIPNGGRIENPLAGEFLSEGRMTWLLNHPDFATASRVVGAIDRTFGSGTSRAVDAQRIEVVVPSVFLAEPVNFIARMGELMTETDATARVVINERTGTIIVGKGVRLREAAVAHGTLTVVIKTDYEVSQPSSFSDAGRTVVVPDVTTDVEDARASVLRVPDTTTVADMVGVLNDIGASPRDIIAILQALKEAGSLQAELQIM